MNHTTVVGLHSKWFIIIMTSKWENFPILRANYVRFPEPKIWSVKNLIKWKVREVIHQDYLWRQLAQYLADEKNGAIFVSLRKARGNRRVVLDTARARHARMVHDSSEEFNSSGAESETQTVWPIDANVTRNSPFDMSTHVADISRRGSTLPSLMRLWI